MLDFVWSRKVGGRSICGRRDSAANRLAYTAHVNFIPPDLASTTLAILAGGKGSRMGMPKSLIRVGNQPILEYLLDRLAWPGPTALITAPGREHPPGWQRFDEEIVDPVSGLGPLRGVLSALERATTPWTVLITVDMPGVGRTQIEELLSSIPKDALGAAFERRPERGRRLIEPFPLAIHNRAESVLRERIERGALSIVKLIEECRLCVREAPEAWPEEIWTNLNQPQDLQAFLDRS